MISDKEIEKYNYLVLNRLSIYLNNYSNHINKEMIDNLVNSTNITQKEALTILLFTFLGFDIDRDKNIYNYYFREMINELDISKYQNNNYYKNIKINNIISSKWKYENKIYEPFELFVYNDLKKLNDGRLIPSIGYFNKEYNYPCVLENNREWMLITPNEMETMTKPINEAYGNVLTYGLGLGYYAYMISLKEDVKTITIIENNKSAIKMFNNYILSQFKFKDKIKIIESDALLYEKTYKEKYDYVFVDIWHDPSDGIPLYLEFKKMEHKNTQYSYWIEDTMKQYIK